MFSGGERIGEAPRVRSNRPADSRRWSPSATRRRAAAPRRGLGVAGPRLWPATSGRRHPAAGRLIPGAMSAYSCRRSDESGFERGATMSRTKPLVTRSRDRAWGATVFAGTRVPVDTMYEYLEAGDTLDEFLRQFPTVTREQAVAVLESARRGTEKTAIPA